jgi:hypothetical protein
LLGLGGSMPQLCHDQRERFLAKAAEIHVELEARTLGTEWARPRWPMSLDSSRGARI